MRIIERYLLRSFLLPLIYISFSFVLLYMVADLFGHLDEIIREHVTPLLVFKYYLNSLPLILVQVLPFACLLAIIYSLGHLRRYNEIMAMHASGIGIWKIIKPYLATGLALSIFVLVLNEKIIPRAYVETRNIKKQFRKNKKEKQKGIIDNVTLYGQENRIIYARRFDLEKKILYDLIILQQDKNQALVSRITAKIAVWQNNTWELHGIILYRLDPEGQFVGEPEYLEDEEIDLTDNPEDFLRQNFIVEAMNSRELYSYINKFRGGSEKIIRRLLVDYYSKQAMPLGTFVLTIIAIPFALIQTTAGRFMSLGISFTMSVLFYGINAVSLGLGKIGVLPPFLSAWIVPLIFILSGIILLKTTPR